MSECNCTSVYENSGSPDCVGSLIKASKKLIMVSRYDNTGALNKVSLPATLNSAYFNTLINEDRDKRWYPLPKFVNVAAPKGESIFETFDNGSKQFVGEGVRTLTAIFPAINPNYLSVLKSGRCADMAVYIVDKNGALVGLTNGEENVLYPFALNPNTIDAIYQWATDTTGSNINFSMEFDPDMKDEEINKIDASAFAPGVNLLNLSGLYDAFVTYANTSATTMTFTLATNFGPVNSKVKVKGLVAADFALFNVTDSAAVTIITAAESPSGTYTLTYASQTVADVIRLTPTKAGIDFSPVVAATSAVV